MAIKTRKDLFHQVDISHIDTKLIKPLSDLVSNITGFIVQNNKAIVGANAFSHESGIHQDGMLKERTTYEIMRPEAVGASKTLLVLGKHSGRHAFHTLLPGTEALGCTYRSWRTSQPSGPMLQQR